MNKEHLMFTKERMKILQDMSTFIDANDDTYSLTITIPHGKPTDLLERLKSS